MEAERWQRLKSIFDAVMELGAGERDAYIVERCAGDEALLATIEKMIHVDAPQMLDTPAMEWFRPPQKDPDALIGTRLGSLEILARIASGGMADVYRGRDGEGSKDVALKVMKRGLDSEEALRRFEVEGRTLMRRGHQNIVSLLRTQVLEDGRPSLVMEYVEGEPIEQFCAVPSRTLDEILALFVVVCSAVQHAHGKLLVHRDLKPANILVQRDGQPKVLDFGIVKLMVPEDPQDTGTKIGSMVPLTPRYASPEQRRGETVSTASDVYSLGVILDELVERFALASSHDLRRIIAKSRQQVPDTRYPSVEALAEDLQRYRRGEPIVIRLSSLRYRAGKFGRDGSRLNM